MGRFDLKRYRFGAATLLITMSSALCSADTIQVSYTTTGAFSAGSSGGTVVGGVLSKSQGGSAASLSFVGTGQSYTVDFNQLFEDAILGTFTAVLNGSANVDLSGALFTLSITQFLPMPDGPGLITTDSIEGKIKNDGVTLDFSDSLQFPNPSQTGKPTIVYTPNDITLSTGNNSSSTFMLTGDIDAIPAVAATSVVPLPPAVLGGMALMGCVGVPRLVRRVRGAATATAR